MKRLLAAVVAVALLCVPALAQDISAKLKDAETLAGEGKYVEAIDALDEAAAALWGRAPLGIRRALWVAQTPAGFGAYTPRDDNVFAAGATMIAYVEPIGFGWRRSGELWRTDLAADLVLKSKDGAELLRKSQFQTIELTSRERNREFMLHFSYTFAGLPKGEYVLDTTLRDSVSEKSGTFSLPFVIR